MSSLPYLLHRQDLQAMATGSRTFLVILLIATVTCIVVLQVSLDTWIVQGGFSLIDYKKDQVDTTDLTTSIGTLDPAQKITTPHTQFVSAAQRIVSLPSASIMLNNTLSKLPLSPKKVPPDSSKVKASDIISKKRLLLGNIQRNQPMLIDKQTRLREILKRTDQRSRPRGDPLKAIRTMPTVKPENVNRVLIVTYFRSGSSFLGDLLQQNWKTFYQFEPLHYMVYDRRISDNRTEEAFSLLSGIYRCNFTNQDHYLNWVRQARNQFLFAHSLFLWFSCRTYTQMCFTPSFVSAVCHRSPYQVVKVPRLTMRQTKQFLQENSDLGIKVVFLSRDPRGIISSRWALDWCVNNTGCANPHVLCDEMADDLAVFNELQMADPSKFIKVRYEDIVLDPTQEAAKLYNFLNLPFSPTVSRFLKSHTMARKAENLNPYSTRRNSSSMAYSWRQRLNFQQVSDIQSSCSEVIRTMNFSLITEFSELEQLTNDTSLSLHSNVSTSGVKLNVSNFPIEKRHKETFFRDFKSTNISQKVIQNIVKLVQNELNDSIKMFQKNDELIGELRNL